VLQPSQGFALCAVGSQMHCSGRSHVASGVADAIGAVGAVLGAQARSSRSQ
jgi:hypothetical protein